MYHPLNAALIFPAFPVTHACTSYLGLAFRQDA